MFTKSFVQLVRTGFVMLMIACLSLPAIAQEKGLNIEIGVEKKEWYEQPWAWVVGAAVFILLLVAILRSGKK